MLLILVLLVIAMLGALVTALYLAYVETEADFPIGHTFHRGCASMTRWTCTTPILPSPRAPSRNFAQKHEPTSLDARRFAPALHCARLKVWRTRNPGS